MGKGKKEPDGAKLLAAKINAKPVENALINLSRDVQTSYSETLEADYGRHMAEEKTALVIFQFVQDANGSLNIKVPGILHEKKVLLFYLGENVRKLAPHGSPSNPYHNEVLRDDLFVRSLEEFIQDKPMIGEGLTRYAQ